MIAPVFSQIAATWVKRVETAAARNLVACEPGCRICFTCFFHFCRQSFIHSGSQIKSDLIQDSGCSIRRFSKQETFLQFINCSRVVFFQSRICFGTRTRWSASGKHNMYSPSSNQSSKIRRTSPSAILSAPNLRSEVTLVGRFSYWTLLYILFFALPKIKQHEREAMLILSVDSALFCPSVACHSVWVTSIQSD